jgi:hypothetical protein
VGHGEGAGVRYPATAGVADAIVRDGAMGHVKVPEFATPPPSPAP